MYFLLKLWTINLKSFEIIRDTLLVNPYILMNYKLEKFWNSALKLNIFFRAFMNYKLEKFWNIAKNNVTSGNLVMNYKLEKFWNNLFLIYIIYNC